MMLLMALWENNRKSFIRNNRVKKISSEPDAVIKRATSGSRAIGSRPLSFSLDECVCTKRSLKITEFPGNTVSSCCLPYLEQHVSLTVSEKAESGSKVLKNSAKCC